MAAPHFVLCLSDEGCEDLVVRKVYEVLDDPLAARAGLLRVVDESGEDYLYPAELFESLQLSPDAVRRLRGATTAA
jgi:hypothetical protein